MSESLGMDPTRRTKPPRGASNQAGEGAAAIDKARSRNPLWNPPRSSA